MHSYLWTQTDVSGGRVGLLADPAVGAGVLGAGLAAGDADGLLPGATDVPAARAQPQPADAADKAAREAQLRAHAVVAGQTTQEERLHQVQPLHSPTVNYRDTIS